jgi:pimeloyl-ACP methyl ester carboxylesterase
MILSRPWWKAALALVLAVPARARADYAVTQETRQVPVVDPGSHPAGMDVFGHPIPTTPVSYVLLSHSQPMLSAQGNTLLICLHGSGDTAANFAKLWITLMRSQAHLVVAVPDYAMLEKPGDQISAIVADTEKKDHVNPKHVILLGHSLGGTVATAAAMQQPGLLAGFASISGAALDYFRTPAMQKYGTKLALYENDGVGEGVHQENLDAHAAGLRNYGFTHVLMETSPRGHHLDYVTFQPDIQRMMAFFNEALADMDQKAKAAMAGSSPNPVTAPPPTPIVQEPPPPANPPATNFSPPPDPAKAPAQPLLGVPHAIPGSNAVVETRPLGTSRFPYAVVKSGQRQTPTPNGATLLISVLELSGVGDDPAPLATRWAGLVDGRPDVVVALPGEHSGILRIAMITEIIDDAVARDHVNPNHVFIVGYNSFLGAPSIWPLVTARPDLFAGFACFLPDLGNFSATDASKDALKNRAGKMAAYFAAATRKQDGDEAVTQLVATVKSLGFTKVAADQPDSGATQADPPSARSIKNMMALFDQQLAANKPQELAAASNRSWLAKSMVLEKRTLAQPQGTYVFLTPDRQKIPATKEATLLICLPDAGESAAHFATNWTALVQSRPDVVVAIPEAAGATPGNPGRPASSDLVRAVIADTVARDHVNPRQVILVGAGAGAVTGGTIAGEFPDQFAGFADIGPDFPETFFTPAMQENAAKPAVYYAYATKTHAVAIPLATSKQFEKLFGFDPVRAPINYAQTNLLCEKFDIVDGITSDQFKFRVTRLMRFFDDVLAENDNKEALAAAGPKAALAEDKRANLLNPTPAITNPPQE